jgi:hypothetical protein
MSPLGKRIKREGSRFSSPMSTFSTNKRTLKAVRKSGHDHHRHDPEPFSPE